jgi:hypothetical protein
VFVLQIIYAMTFKNASTFLFASLLASAPLEAGEPAVPQMIVDPSATKLALAKADLTVSTLKHDEQAYQGSYHLKVSPFSFKSEQGTLFLNATDDTVRKMSLGEAVEFTGKATNVKDGNVKVVTGKTSPKDTENGAVSFSVQTENGVLVFNTSYHLVRR